MRSHIFCFNIMRQHDTIKHPSETINLNKKNQDPDVNKYVLSSKRWTSGKKIEQATTGTEYESNFYPTGHFWMHGYKVLRGHTTVTFTKRDSGHMKNQPDMTPWEEDKKIVDT